MSNIAISNFLDKSTQEHALATALKARDFIEYHNPFESKLAMPKNASDASFFAQLIYEPLMSRNSTWWVSKLLGVDISHADWMHYGGVFVYRDGDYLKPHVDAGIHPRLHLRKVATACLYLTSAQLEFWHGEPAHYSKPCVAYVSDTIQIEASTLILFTNDDLAWHAVPHVTGPERVCITLSYLAPVEFKDSNYTNIRTRAYFARQEGESNDLDELREQRASEDTYKEMYRVYS